MKTLYYLLLTFAVIISACSCTKNNLLPGTQTDSIIISQTLFANESADNFTIKNAFIKGDSLYIDITSGGCSGRSWVIRVVDAGVVAESYPVQRFIKIFLENNELCKALITRRFTIDLTPIKLSGEDKISINLERWRGSLLYEPSKAK